MPLRWRHVIVTTVALVAAGCGGAPTLPAADDLGEIHELVVGSKGSDFLLSTSTYEWPDGGAQPARLFDWVPRDAGSVDAGAATRAAATAHAVATFLSGHESDLLEIRTGWFGHDETVGQLNPKLVNSYAVALIPFQGAFACDQADAPAFDWFANDCSTAVRKARPVFTVLNTDSGAAKSFADAADKRMDAYLTKFAAGVATPSKRFDEGPTFAGTLLGLVHVGADKSGIDVRTIADLENRADYFTASALIPAGSNPGLPAAYFSDGKLLSPEILEKHLGTGELANYYASLRTYLGALGGVQTRLSNSLRDAYYAVTGG